MKLNSPSVIGGKLKAFGVGVLKVLGVIFAATCIIAVVHVVARWLYATLGYFEFEWSCSGMWGCRQVPSDVPWYGLNFKEYYFWNFDNAQSSSWLLCHVLSIAAFVLIALAIILLKDLLFEQPEGSGWVESDEETSTGEETDKYVHCEDGGCVCRNHHEGRPDRFEEGQWRWQPSCYNPDCTCREHENDEDGDTFAPELKNTASFWATRSPTDAL